MVDSTVDTDAEHRAPPAADDDWRIDDLARRAEVTVDTIRYYQREGLLPSGARAGRSRRYGPEHLERLERIRALQARRFSLAAIRALLDRDAPGSLEGLLEGHGEAAFDRDELVEGSGVPADVVQALAAAGLLLEPAEHGHSVYDSDDLEVLRSVADLRRLGIPDEVVVEVTARYVRGLAEIQRGVAAVFAGMEGPPWRTDEREQFHAHIKHEAGRVARDLRVIADYTQQRNVQRLVLRVIEARAHTGLSDA